MSSAALLPGLLAGAGVLIIAGAAKLARPAEAADFLASLRLPRSTALVRVGALLEIGVGAAAFRWPGPAAAAVAVLFSGLAAVVALQLRRGVMVPCGCLGSRELPPSRVHLALNVACAAAAAAAAALPPPAYSALATRAPAEAAIALLAALATAVLAQAALVLLPPTLGAWAGGRG